MAISKARLFQEFLEEPFSMEERTFRQKHRQLLQRYEGQFVVLYQGRVVGHGYDDEELARKAFAQFGDVPFYVVKVEKEPTVYELPSPKSKSDHRTFVHFVTSSRASPPAINHRATPQRPMNGAQAGFIRRRYVARPFMAGNCECTNASWVDLDPCSVVFNANAGVDDDACRSLYEGSIEEKALHPTT